MYYKTCILIAIYFLFSPLLYNGVDIAALGYVQGCACRGQRSTFKVCCLLPLWVLGMELRFSGLSGECFCWLSILLALDYRVLLDPPYSPDLLPTEYCFFEYLENFFAEKMLP